jgi:muramoyltetrapeptide carboxypeptidase
MRIAVVAPAGRFQRETADRAIAFVAVLRPDIELYFHPQCFLTSGHFAGTDEQRLEAFVEVANDPGFEAVWFARGGYGSNRIAHAAVERLNRAAREKAYLGYSDIGYMLAALYKAGFPHVAHGPMPQDIRRAITGKETFTRGLSWLVHRCADCLEPHVKEGVPAVAFNLTVLGTLLGTNLQPDLDRHVLMIEDTGEMAYRIDRSMSHVVGQKGMRRLRGIRIGRFDPVPANEPAFGEKPERIGRNWCRRAGIAYLGRADIGHDGANKVVPFGTP